MIIKDIRASRIDFFYDVLLVEEQNKKAISIAVGKHEAENMALALDNIKTDRPLTYDSFCNILQTYSIALKEVVINKFMDGNYYSVCVFSDPLEKITEFDTRPSDALNLALRCGCPIYVDGEVVEQVGFDSTSYFESWDKEKIQNEIETLDNMSEFGINMLKDLLNDAIENEDYKRASILRDRIRRLEENR